MKPSLFFAILVCEVFLWESHNKSKVYAWPWSDPKAAAADPTPPTEPTYTYVSPEFSVQEIGDCVDGSRVWLYAPTVPKPGEGADVVVYLHGYLGGFPTLYENHIEHLVKQGNYVIFPQFQEGLCEPGSGQLLSGVKQFFGQASPAVWADRTALRVQQTLATIIGRPNYNRVFLYGHSLGGAFALMWGNLIAALDEGEAIDVDATAAVLASPQPGGFGAIPGAVTTLFHFLFGEDIDVPAAAPQTTFPVAVLHGNDDTIAPLTDIMPSYDVLGSTSKAIYQAQTDAHGSPVLAADHYSALCTSFSSESVNDMDWRYYWSALDQVMAGTSVTELVFDLGSWSDGVAVLAVQRLA